VFAVPNAWMASTRGLTGFAAAAAAVLIVSAAPTAGQPPTCRDRTLWPFSNDSIWNMPLGSSANYTPANIYAAPLSPPASFHNDQDFFIVAAATDPVTQVRSFVGPC
jgi:hypothetical protein